jgi:hypothetical protein
MNEYVKDILFPASFIIMQRRDWLDVSMYSSYECENET